MRQRIGPATQIAAARPSAQQGLTLVELATTLAVAAIGLSLAVPTVIGLTTERQATATANRLMADMTLARAEAIRRGRPVVVCSSRDGSTCSGSTEWADGWIVVSDPEGGDAPSATSQTSSGNRRVELIRVAPPAGGGLKLGGSHAQVVYRPDGTSTAL